MKYFSKATTIEEAKTLYRKLAFANHSDVTGGSDEAMKEINAEFDMVCSFLKHRTPASEQATSSGSTYRNEFYTQNGWKGDKYDSSLWGKDIAKLLREYVKYVYPTWKFSITSTYNSVSVYVTEGPMSPFCSKEEVFAKIKSSSYRMGNYTDREINDEINRAFEKVNHQVNHFYIDNDCYLSDFTKLMFEDINKFLKDYTRDDSDAMTDYFDCNLYTTLGVGKWDKPFQIVEKVARIAPTKVTKGAKLLTK